MSVIVRFGFSTYHIPDWWMDEQYRQGVKDPARDFVALDATQRTAIMQRSIRERQHRLRVRRIVRGEEPMMHWHTMPFGFDAAQAKLNADAEAYATKDDLLW